MRKRKILILICAIILTLLALFLVLLIVTKPAPTDKIKTSVYVWSIDEIDFTYLDEVVGYANIGTIYLCGDIADFNIKKAKIQLAV